MNNDVVNTVALSQRIDQAFAILRAWRSRARLQKKDKAMRDVELIIGVLKDLSGR